MTIRDEFLHLLRTDPDFRDIVRRQLLSEELLALPGRFAQAQARTDERLDQLAQYVVEGLRQLTQRVDQLAQYVADGLDQLTQRVDQLAQRVDQLAQAQARTDERLDQLTQRVDQLAEAQLTMQDALTRLAEAQARAAERLDGFASWRQGEDGRRRGERYEAETIRGAPALFAGGDGGSTAEYVVRTRLTELLAPVLREGSLPAEENPFLANLVWWKAQAIALVEASIHVHAADVQRAAQRAETMRRAGPSVVPVVIGEEWASNSVRSIADRLGVEWRVGDDLSEGFVQLRRSDGGRSSAR